MKTKTDIIALRDAAETIIRAIGDDPNRPGLKDTPARFARAWAEFADYEDTNHSTMFEASGLDQLVVVSGMRVWSMCEHHLLPFWCDVSVGYIADCYTLGLSKFARIAHLHSHKLTTQEGLVQDIAKSIQEITRTDNVAALAAGEHTCMAMRGIRTRGLMQTSVMNGIFRKTSEPARTEFLAMCRPASM